MNKEFVASREEIEILKKYYGFDEAGIKELEEKNQLAEVIRKIKLERFLLCKGHRLRH